MQAKWLTMLLLLISVTNFQFADADEVWIGTSPFCDGDKRDCTIFDMNYVRSDKYGDGKYCLTGTKVLCRTKQLETEIESTEDTKLTVVSYNVFERPFFITHDGQTERTCHITRALLNLLPRTDVIIFEEAFLGGCWYDNSRVSLKAQLSSRGFAHSTDIVGSFRFSPDSSRKSKDEDAYFIINGGVFIASRHPIVRTNSIVFSDSGHADVFSKKGAVYAQVVKGSVNYHIVGTHMQAQPGPSYDSIRVAQATELNSFLQRMKISAADPVIIGGDFNCDSINNPKNVRDVINAMGAKIPEIVGNVDATFDPFTNDVVEPGNNVKEWLDFVVTSNRHRQPTTSSLRSFRLLADQDILYCNSAKMQPYYVWPWSPLCHSVKTTRHLSDHYPVMAEFQF